MMLIEGFDRALGRVMQTYHKENLKLNKNKCHFWCTRVPFFREIVSSCDIQPEPCKLVVDMPALTIKKTSSNCRHNELPRKILTSHSREVQSMQDAVKADVSNIRMDIAQHISETLWESEVYHRNWWFCEVL